MATPQIITLRRFVAATTVVGFLGLAVAGCVGAGFVLGNMVLLLLAGVVGAALVGGVLLWPSAATMMVLFILYTNAAVVAVRFHGVPMVVGAAVPLLLISPLAYYLVIRRGNPVLDNVLPWIVLFVAAQMVSTVFSDNSTLSMGILVTSLVEGLCLYFLILNVVRTRQELRRATWVLLAAGAFMGGLSALQQVTRSYDKNYGGFAQMSNAAFETGQADMHGEIEQRRLAGPLGEQNRYAQIMLMLLPIGLFRIWGERSQALKLAAIIATLLTAAGLVLAFSRGAAVSFLFCALVMLFMGYVKPRQAIALMAGLLIVAMAVPAYSTRLMSLSRVTSGIGDEDFSIEAADTSVQSRYTETLAAANMMYKNPLVGVGPGRYPAFYHQFANEVGGNMKETARQPHILYFGLGAELGLPGLIAFIAVLVASLRKMVQARRAALRIGSPTAHMVTGFMLAIVAYLASGIFLHFAFVRYFWLILALAGAASRIALAEAAPMAAKGRAVARRPRMHHAPAPAV